MTIYVFACFFFFCFLSHPKDNGRNYDTAIMRLAVAVADNWRGIAPSTEGVDFNPEPPIFTAKFAKCQYQEHMLAIANEDGNVRLCLDYDSNADDDIANFFALHR